MSNLSPEHNPRQAADISSPVPQALLELVFSSEQLSTTHTVTLPLGKHPGYPPTAETDVLTASITLESFDGAHFLHVYFVTAGVSTSAMFGFEQDEAAFISASEMITNLEDGRLSTISTLADLLAALKRSSIHQDIETKEAQ